MGSFNFYKRTLYEYLINPGYSNNPYSNPNYLKYWADQYMRLTSQINIIKIMFQMKDKILYGLFIVLLFVSCQPQKITYRPSCKYMTINDSVRVIVGNGGLLYNGDFHYSVSFRINNKSQSIVYIDSLSCKMVSIYKDTAILYRRNYLSDNSICSNFKKKVNIAFNKKDTLIVSDYFSNREKLKQNHQFVMNLNLIIGDSIIPKEVIFEP